ncbi:uncharacterized protein DSM5745_09672 [Aspergillus mulundensis]|uniref:Uncharacterized protein n=1 Tax=Aspergillus mulundensis TaxID=1810919 RepID=A0A3D8QVQ5_9EURO|nr:Uncharacterized protein DSM5745_09672 [Aspergillus mulundensis]RDW65933.1 Uncharacterized protein DSM5745_09672 [Aspergillus mulundensis]
MGTANSLPPQIQSCLLDDKEIHFTPVKNSKAPRIWDRKPSTSFLNRAKPRKVWKRFRSSFNSMKALQQLITPDATGLKESELLHEINARANADYCRGVKRQCRVFQRSSDEDDSETPSGRGRSFLETKWESEVSRKRRKLPATTNSTDEHMIDDDLQDDEDEEMAEVGEHSGGTTSSGNSAVQEPEKTGEFPTQTPGPGNIGAANPEALHGEPSCLANKERGVIVNIKSPDTINLDEVRGLTPTHAADSAAATDDASDVATAADEEPRPDVATKALETESKDTMAVPVELTTEQESTLVRSALRSSLDGEDTALLNDFLSKAKAKREAKAAAEAETATPVIASDLEEQEQEQPPTPQQQVFVEIPTPERRALEDLDANTTSPQKSPSKADEKEDSTGDNDSSSPVARRSTRVRSLQRAAAPSSRTTLSLRRARGNEFVFLQRTDAQKLALETRQNTKHNRGDALMPKYVLQNLGRTPEPSFNIADDGLRRNNKPKKYVTWNEERLEEYEGDASGSDDELASSKQDSKATTSKPTDKKKEAGSRRTSLPQSSLRTGVAAPGSKTAPAAAATTASPTAATGSATRGRRVRRLGPPKPLESTLITDSSNDSTSSPSSPTATAGSTPIAKRKKLMPKSPKTMTRTSSKLPTAAASGSNDVPSLLSGGRSVKTNLLKVNAGSTPMPRRVRRS